MKQVVVILFLLGSNLLVGQNEGNIWYFGSSAALDFNSGVPVPITNSAMWAVEGCSSIADSSGNLLFYTEGVTVWNKNHIVMQNGNSLLGAVSSTQSALIVKQPNSNSIYYVFTTDYQTQPDGLNYSQIDMSLAGGLGGVTGVKNIQLATPVAEKVTAVMHANSQDIWIVTHLMNSDAFYCYLVTSTGVNPIPVISNVGNFVINNASGSGAQGQLQASPQGNKLAIANRGDSSQVFDFNNSTGVVSTPITFYYSTSLSATYGCEFSPSGNRLYFTTTANGGYYQQLLQFDLTSPNVAASEQIISSHFLGFQWGQLELGPDGKIYIARGNRDFIGVINNPNELGSLCNFIDKGAYLGGSLSKLGLPQSIYSSFKFSNFSFNNICYGDSMCFTMIDTSNVDSVSWNFGDISSGSNNFSNLLNPKHLFSDTGTFVVTLIEYSGALIDTSINSFYVSSLPIFTLGADTSICVGDTLFLGNFNPEASFLWQDSSINYNFNITQQGVYWLEITVNSCSVTDTINVITDICTSVNEVINDFEILISPNPSTGRFTIEGINQVYNLSIYNAVGQLLYTENNVLETSKRVDISNYSKGLILIRIESEDEVYYQKIIKE